MTLGDENGNGNGNGPGGNKPRHGLAYNYNTRNNISHGQMFRQHVQVVEGVCGEWDGGRIAQDSCTSIPSSKSSTKHPKTPIRSQHIKNTAMNNEQWK